MFNALKRTAQLLPRPQVRPSDMDYLNQATDRMTSRPANARQPCLPADHRL